MHDEPWIPVALGIIGVLAAFVIVYYLYRWSEKKGIARTFWYVVAMLATAIAFQIDPRYASLALGVPTFIGFGYFLWRFIKAANNMDKLSSILFAGALFFMGLSFRSYVVIEYTIITAVFLVGGIVAEFKKLEK